LTRSIADSVQPAEIALYGPRENAEACADHGDYEREHTERPKPIEQPREQVAAPSSVAKKVWRGWAQRDVGSFEK